ncbi:protein tumorous imaginal discs, mitochondrial-like isoform X2 [Drosophila guanche]|uniref:protein tumorous imaginal discs, mitochondrial-like isoform X2 n=1 Tax=Drosophila guanche TaxID=7266 RepID=UPI0014718885|nr:protein tumorous imaginal discs, mitochondrial-like isoform X2 [Drosophila guanche]
MDFQTKYSKRHLNGTIYIATRRVLEEKLRSELESGAGELYLRFKAPFAAYDIEKIAQLAGELGEIYVIRFKVDFRNESRGYAFLQYIDASLQAKAMEQCQGKGYINRRDCEPCGNRGFVLSSVEVLVKVPPGSKDGEVMTIQNPNTNERINYRLVVERSVYFRRDGLNVYSDKLLTISQAILGGTFTVPGLHEPVELRVAPGTQPNTQITIKSRGIRSEQGVGNHIVTLKVFIPTKLSMKQRLLFLGLAQAEDPIFERQTASSYRNSEL